MQMPVKQRFGIARNNCGNPLATWHIKVTNHLAFCAQIFNNIHFYRERRSAGIYTCAERLWAHAHRQGLPGSN